MYLPYTVALQDTRKSVNVQNVSNIIAILVHTILVVIVLFHAMLSPKGAKLAAALVATILYISVISTSVNKLAMVPESLPGVGSITWKNRFRSPQAGAWLHVHGNIHHSEAMEIHHRDLKANPEAIEP